jgi:hypothetical protein
MDTQYSIFSQRCAWRWPDDPRHLSLVTQLPEREGVTSHYCRRRGGGAVRKPTPAAVSYARAFFRFLTGSSKISGKAINQVRGAYWLKGDKISLARYEEAFDILISSRGRLCYPPLGTDTCRPVSGAGVQHQRTPHAAGSARG